MIDRYTKVLLTVIAAALVYLCVVLTPLPGLQAQTAKRPGDPTGPAEAVIVGWRTNDAVPVAFQRPIPVTAAEPLRVTGSVTTERSSNVADRVVVVGWEENAVREKPQRLHAIVTQPSGVTAGLPVSVQK